MVFCLDGMFLIKPGSIETQGIKSGIPNAPLVFSLEPFVVCRPK